MNNRKDKSPSQRQLRVGEELRHALATILERGEARDPDLADISITVTEVRLGPDLRNATVFVMPLGGGETKTVVNALNRAQPFLRRRMTDMVKLKYAPNISFKADDTFAEVSHIENLLRSPAVRRDLEKD